MRLLLCQLPVDELGHAVVGFLKHVRLCLPFLGHLSTIMIYHDPSCVWIRVSHQLLELVYPVTAINRPLDVLVTIGTCVHVVDLVLLQRMQIKTQHEYCFWFVL